MYTQECVRHESTRQSLQEVTSDLHEKAKEIKELKEDYETKLEEITAEVIQYFNIFKWLLHKIFAPPAWWRSRRSVTCVFYLCSIVFRWRPGWHRRGPTKSEKSAFVKKSYQNLRNKWQKRLRAIRGESKCPTNMT